MTVNDPQDNTQSFAPERRGESSGGYSYAPDMQIGPYRLIRLIGEGGMGQVWLAEQMEPVRRQVAIKLIKLGMDTREVVGRFESERQALALMDHPAIAKVFDAGSTPEGRPYFVMEYVAGESITVYCDRNRLTTRQRMELMIQVCEGVQHAHQKAIIHRDLKPSNILITEVDGKPAPRIIDFGVAKAVSRGLNAETMLTQAGVVVGTLGYMSPEQADSGGEDIDTRSDVYSLGVVLYELLVGALPIDLRKVALSEVLRRLREEDAPSPSTRLRALRGDSAITAQNRGTEAPTLERQLRGDADSIALKALEKDRKRRYSTPSDLASDLGRYLRNEPVTAHAPSFLYRSRKYVRRHRLGVLIAASAVALVIGFGVAQSIQLSNTRRQRDRADRITEFMTSMYKVSDPSEARGNTITAREILDRSSNSIEAGLEQDPAVQSQLMEVMATTYMNLGLYSRAHTLAEHALEIRKRTKGPQDRTTLESMSQMGTVLFHEGRDVEAEAMQRNAIDVEARVLGGEDLLTLDTKAALAKTLDRGAHYVEAEKLQREVVAIETRKLGPEDKLTLRSRNGLVSALQGQSRFEEAEKEFRQLIEIEQRRLGAGDPYTLATMHNFANMLAEQGRHSEAEALYRQTLETERRVLGPEHPETADTLLTLANTVRTGRGRQAEAEGLYRQSLEIELRAVGPDHAYTTRAKEGLANELATEHQYPEAERLLREVLATRTRVLGPDNTDTLLAEYNLGSVVFHQKRYGEAEKLLRSTLAAQARVLDKNDPDTLASKTLLARTLLEEKEPREAERLCREALDAQLRLLGPQHSDTQESVAFLAESLVAQGRYEEATGVYMESIAAIQRLPHGDVSTAWYNFAETAADAGHKDDALHALEAAVNAGFADAERMKTEEDLKTLRLDSRFQRAVVQAKKNAEAVETEDARKP